MKKVFAILVIGVALFSAAPLAQAAPTLLGNIPCAGAAGNDCTPCDIVKLAVNASDLILYLSGIFAIIMFIFGGVVMLTAYGNENRISWGRNTVIATAVGIMIVLLAWTFVNVTIETIYGGQTAIFGHGWNEGGYCAQQK